MKQKPEFWGKLSPSLRYQYDIIRQWPSETIEQYNRRYNDLMRKIEKELRETAEKEKKVKPSFKQNFKTLLANSLSKDVLWTIFKVIFFFVVGLSVGKFVISL